MSVSVAGNILNLRARVALQEPLKHGQEQLMGAQRGSDQVCFERPNIDGVCAALVFVRF